MNLSEESTQATGYKYQTLEEIERLLESDPEFSRLYIKRANYYARQSKNPFIRASEVKFMANKIRLHLVPEMREKYNRLKKCFPGLDRDDQDVVSIIMKDYEKTFELDKIYENFRTLLADSNSFEKAMQTTPRNCVEFRARADHLVDQFPNRFLEFYNDYTSALELSPNNYEARSDRMIFMKRLGFSHDLLVNECQDVIRVEPNYAIIYNNFGNVLDRARDARALSYYDVGINLLEKIPENTKNKVLSELYFNRAKCKGNQNFTEGVPEDYLKAVELNPKNYSAFNNLGAYYFRKDEFHLSVVYFTKSLQIRKGYGRSLIGRAQAYSKMQKFNLAIKDYTTNLLCEDPVFEKLSFLYRGQCFLQIGLFEKAILDFTKSLKLGLDVGRYWRNRAVEKLRERIMKM